MHLGACRPCARLCEEALSLQGQQKGTVLAAPAAPAAALMSMTTRLLFTDT